MKLYEKIYLPERQEGARAFRDNQGDVPVVMHGPVIVLTIEELREVWDKAELGGFKEGKWSSSLDATSFTTYLQSKGITL